MSGMATVNLWDRIVGWYRGTVLYEIVEHFVQVYFTVRPVEYEKVTLTASGATAVRNGILAVAIGVIFSAAAVFYTRRYPGGFVRKLLKCGASTPETAKTLDETGYFYSVGIRSNLKRGGVLTRVVVRAGDPEPPIPLELREETNAEETAEGSAEEIVEGYAEEPVEGSAETVPEEKTTEEKLRPFDFTTDRFYIPEVLRYRAEVRYTQKGSGVLPLILTIFLTVVASGLLCRFLPDLLGLVNKLL